MNLHKHRPLLLTTLATTLSAALLSGCLFGGDPNPPATIDTPIKVSSCQDLAPALQKTADSLVRLGTAKLTGDLEYMLSDTVQNWNDFKSRNTAGAVQLYDQALKVAPGHCGAMFGKAMASAMMLTQDPKLDAFVKKAEAYNDSNTNGNGSMLKVNSGLALVKLSPDQGAQALLKLSAGLKYFDPPTVTEFQALIESTLMPKLDSTIASLETALSYNSFAFEFTNKRGVTYQLDQGDIGPLLGGLKVAKAFLTVAAGYQWEIALNGNYQWIDTVWHIGWVDSASGGSDNNYDNLRPSQIAALDHLTGLFQSGSPFSKIKPAWKAKVKNIPTLLLSAVADAQKGLRYNIAEARKTTGQEHDLYVVGNGMDNDVDSVDLLDAIELLERSKKYLTGEVPITYNKGIRTLRVDFTKLFEIDNVQSLLPYFKFYPYAQWNDTVRADTAWGMWRQYPTDLEILNKLGYKSFTWNQEQVMSLRGHEGFLLKDTMDIVMKGQFYHVDTVYFEPNPILGQVTPVDGSPCTFKFIKEFEPVLLPPDTASMMGDMPQYTLKPVLSQGTFKITGCRENQGNMETVNYINAVTRGPIYFTNAAGEKTLETIDLKKYDNDMAALKSKIFFRDPTFGGVFPGQTQDGIWDVIQSLRFVETRSRLVCPDYPDPYAYYPCHMVKPSNPSDLDLYFSVTHWMDAVL